MHIAQLCFFVNHSKPPKIMTSGMDFICEQTAEEILNSSITMSEPTGDTYQKKTPENTYTV